jgi:tetratricopeptide (TPR) repeat protein
MMDDFTSAYQSLIREDIPYHHAIQIFIQRIFSEIEKGKYSLASKLIDELKFTGDYIAGKLERALIRLECARAYYNSRQHERAIRDLNFAISLLESDAKKSIYHYHYCAAAQWMLGCILLEKSNMKRAALISWQRSLDSFGILIYHAETLPPDNSWYEDRYIVMCQAIEDLIRGISVSASKSLAKQASAQLHGRPFSSLYSASFNYIDVIVRIPMKSISESG